MKLQSAYLAFALILTTLCGCASTAQNKQLNTKVSEEDSVQKTQDLHSKGDEVIKNASGLTEDQKEKLLVIRAQTREQLSKLYKESLQLRSVLVKDVISKTDNDVEVNLIKKRLRKNEDQRLDVIFKAVDQANALLGKTAIEHQKELEETLREEREDRGGDRMN